MKWVGGKTQLLPEICELLPKEINEIETYIEPFIGGGAVLFHLLEKYKFKSVYISDINPELTLCYDMVKINVSELIKHLEDLQTRYLPLEQDKRKVMFEKVRKKWNKGINFKSAEKNIEWLTKRVAETIFLNRTCFNGIFRVNSKGEFNVPIGSYKNPRILDEANLRSVSSALQNVHINTLSYEECSKFVEDDKTFIYFDPPYRPLPGKPSFTSYVKSGFNDTNQIDLANFFSNISEKAKLMLSNSDTKDGFFDNLYGDFKISNVMARRNINSDGSKRGKISEIIVRNYLVPTQSRLGQGKD